MIGLEPSALNPKQNEQAVQWHVIKTSDGGGFIEKKLVVDEKQTTILLVHTKKIMSKTSSSSLSISYIGVGQILMGCSKKKKMFYFQEDLGVCCGYWEVVFEAKLLLCQLVELVMTVVEAGVSSGCPFICL